MKKKELEEIETRFVDPDAIEQTEIRILLIKLRQGQKVFKNNNDFTNQIGLTGVNQIEF
jgi:hypothetical protein